MRYLVFLLTTLMFFKISALAQDPPPPRDSATDAAGHKQLAGILEDDFTNMVITCMPNQAGNKHLMLEKKGAFGSSTTKPSTAIPVTIKDAIDTNRFVKGPVGQSLGSLLTYVYSQAEKDNDVDSVTDVSKALPLPISSSPNLQVNTNYSGVTLGETCGSSISTKISVSGGYSVPIADIKASLAADAASSTNWSMDLVEGTFQSPLPDLFKTYDPAIALYPRLILWKLYYDQKVANPTLLTSQNWLLQTLHGIAVYKVYGAKQNFSIQASAGATISPAFLKSTDSIDASYNSGVNTKINTFQVMTYLDPATQKGERTWFALPTPAQLASDHFSTTLKDGAQTFVAGAGSIHTEYRLAQGMPRSVCASGLWAAEGTANSIAVAAGGLTVVPTVDASNKPDADPVLCSFAVSYSVPRPIPATGINLDYRLVFAIDANTKYTLFGPPVTLVSADGPNLTSGLFDPTYQPSAGNTQLDWGVKLQVAQTPLAQITPGSIPTISNTTLTCGTTTIPVVPGAVVFSGPPNNALQFTVSKNITADNLNISPNGSKVSCNLNGTATFSLVGIGNVDRTFPSGQAIVLSYPPPQAPAKPSGVSAVGGHTQVSLSWQPLTSASSYNVYRGITSGGAVLYKTALTATTFTDIGLTTGTSYFYIVTGVNGSGEGPKSDEVSAAAQ